VLTSLLQASTNTVHLLLPEVSGFPVEELCGTSGVSHFYTVGVAALGWNIFDLNYFHPACKSTPTVDAALLKPDGNGCMSPLVFSGVF
jgi:hypothetical protein